MFLLELHHGLLAESFELQTAQHSGWRLVTPCDGDLPEYDKQGGKVLYKLGDIAPICPILREAGDLHAPKYEEFIRLLMKMFSTAQSGQNWPDVMYDQVHEVGRVNVRGISGKIENYVIIQFGKKKNLIRVLAFISAFGRKRAFISHVFEKPANSKTTPKKEIVRAQNNLQEYLNAIEAKNIQLISAQGGKNEFLKMV